MDKFNIRYNPDKLLYNDFSGSNNNVARGNIAFLCIKAEIFADA